MTTFIQIDYPAPDPQHPCSACEGRGVTGQQFGTDTDSGFLLVDLFCLVCDGCGSADHGDCDPGAHATAEVEDFLDEDADPECKSCRGREWNPIQAFTDDEVVYARMPCGCTEHRARFVQADEVQ